MPTIFKAVAVHKHKNGIARDNFVNVFHFDPTGTDASDAERVAEKVRDFFALDNGVQSEALCNMFGGQVALTGHEVRIYPIDAATGLDVRGAGAPPIHTEVYDHVGRVLTANPNLPSEVALCLSYKNTESSAVPPRQRRGRMYFGPIVDGGAKADEATTEISRPSAYLQQLLLDAGKFLAGDGVDELVVYSRPFEGRTAISAETRANAGGANRPLPALPARAGAIYRVTDVWVDNSWDTVRRRGERPSARLTGLV